MDVIKTVGVGFRLSQSIDDSDQNHLITFGIKLIDSRHIGELIFQFQNHDRILEFFVLVNKRYFSLMAY